MASWQVGSFVAVKVEQGGTKSSDEGGKRCMALVKVAGGTKVAAKDLV